MKKSDNTLTILLYHGVTDVKPVGIENYSGKHCRLSEFIRQMAFLKNHCNILSMDEAVEHFLERRPFPENAIAVTFDDGFKNNFMLAMPILSEFKIPATFYITTGLIGTEKMFWVDAIEDCINRSKRRSIAIMTGQRTRRMSLTSKGDKIKTAEYIKNYCKTLTVDRKDIMVKALSEAAGIEAAHTSSKNYLTMSWDDIRQIKSNPLFTIGGHSLRHDALARLSPKSIEVELYRSIDKIRQILHLGVRHYSYPEGQKGDYNEYAIECLKKLGIVCCPSAIEGVNTLKDDLFHLRRISVGFNGRNFPFFKK